jgi:hypothetical protein
LRTRSSAAFAAAAATKAGATSGASSSNSRVLTVPAGSAGDFTTTY